MSTSSLHTLLLLSDSALPLGSFAFSSGLESFLAHSKQPTSSEKLAAFEHFFYQSIENLAATALPYVLEAYRDSSCLERLDNDFDASTPCTVARRASIAQGRALLAIWERALAQSADSDGQAFADVSSFAVAMKTAKPESLGLQLNGHLAPLLGAVCRALGLSSDDTSYVFLMNHAKAVLSAAVRASVMGPYQSQAILASMKLQSNLKVIIKRYQDVKPEDAAVISPMMDIWMGRHELLYSRIFNS